MARRQRMASWLEQVWYGTRPLERTLLLPLSALFCAVAKYRRKKLTAVQQSFSTPIIIVGNIAVGGTGKTPLTMRLVQLLQQNGYRPGIVSRGYGSQSDKAMPKPVTYQNKPEDVGDEALMMAVSTGVPVVVSVDRPNAVSYLLENYDVNMVVADDGLQHYALGRDIEIAVVDGSRRLGNGYCLPAGPLREKPGRLHECDFVVCNGRAEQGEYAMKIRGSWLVSVQNKRVSRPLTEFSGKAVHVVTGIGNPGRFVATLQGAGLQCTTHFYPDHYLFQGDEFCFADNSPILMTEKDAVKCQQFADDKTQNCWFLPVKAELDEGFEQAFLQKVKELTING